METLKLAIENNISINNKLECLINGKKERYHFCGTKDLDTCINFYNDCVYIGSSKEILVNGVLNESKEIIHFFRKLIK